MTPAAHCLSSAAAASAAIIDLVQIARDDAGIDTLVTTGLRNAEVVENLADALQSAIAPLLEAPNIVADDLEALGQLQAAVARFLDGWA